MEIGLTTKRHRKRKMSGQLLLTIALWPFWMAFELVVSAFPPFLLRSTSTHSKGGGVLFLLNGTGTITHLDDALSIVSVIDLSLKSIHPRRFRDAFWIEARKTSLSPRRPSFTCIAFSLLLLLPLLLPREEPSVVQCVASLILSVMTDGVSERFIKTSWEPLPIQGCVCMSTCGDH